MTKVNSDDKSILCTHGDTAIIRQLASDKPKSLNPKEDSDSRVDLLRDSWNAEYVSGRYVDEKPVEFTNHILTVLEQNPEIRRQRGLYVGCGNGRNYIMLAKAGLDLIGLDVSGIGFRQISEKKPELAHNLVQSDFSTYVTALKFGYVVAIQSFQHGNKAVTSSYFEKAVDTLVPNGLLFVRVNAVGTDILYAHTITEESEDGFTALYHDGPKKGLHIRFFSENGLNRVLNSVGLRTLRTPEKLVTRRNVKDGSWVQWEVVAVLCGVRL